MNLFYITEISNEVWQTVLTNKTRHPFSVFVLYKHKIMMK